MVSCIKALPDAMDDTAAQVHTTTLFPSLRPRVWVSTPAADSATLHRMPAGVHSPLPREASMNPVRLAAADNPKHAPAFRAGWEPSVMSSCRAGAAAVWEPAGAWHGWQLQKPTACAGLQKMTWGVHKPGRTSRPHMSAACWS